MSSSQSNLLKFLNRSLETPGSTDADVPSKKKRNESDKNMKRNVSENFSHHGRKSPSGFVRRKKQTKCIARFVESIQKKELFRSCIVMSDFLGKVVWWFGQARHTLHSSEWTSELRRKFPALNEQLKA